MKKIKYNNIYGVSIFKTNSSFKHYNKIKYYIVSNNHIGYGNIMKICRDIDKYGSGFCVFNLNNKMLDDYWYHIDGKGMVCTKLKNKNEYIQEDIC